jgi:putative restriction endonuclease
VCELRERPLLDAAHIIPDRLPEGIPTVRNGLAMCPTHHRAYDQSILLVTERYRIEVQRGRLEHLASPATQRALLDFHGQELHLPKRTELQPDALLLRKRCEFAA